MISITKTWSAVTREQRKSFGVAATAGIAGASLSRTLLPAERLHYETPIGSDPHANLGSSVFGHRPHSRARRLYWLRLRRAYVRTDRGVLRIGNGRFGAAFDASSLASSRRPQTRLAEVTREKTAVPGLGTAVFYEPYKASGIRRDRADQDRPSDGPLPERPPKQMR